MILIANYLQVALGKQNNRKYSVLNLGPLTLSTSESKVWITCTCCLWFKGNFLLQFRTFGPTKYEILSCRRKGYQWTLFRLPVCSVYRLFPFSIIIIIIIYMLRFSQSGPNHLQQGDFYKKLKQKLTEP